MRTIIILFAILGCSTCIVQVSLGSGKPMTVSAEPLADLSRGMTEHEVEEMLKARGIHQFTAVLSNGIVRCNAYYRSKEYYFVFTNGYLSAVCEPPPTGTRRVPYEGSWLIESVLGDPEVRIAQVLNAPDMIGPALVAALKPAPPPKQSWDPGLTAAYLLVQAVFGNPLVQTLFGNKTEKRQRIYRELLERYDPFKIDPNTALEVVETRLGFPNITETLSVDRAMRYYGSLEYGLTGTRELMWLAIVYDKGKVIRVFTHDFIDFTKIKTLEAKYE